MQLSPKIMNMPCCLSHRLAEAVKKGSFKKLVLYGEMSSIPLDQLTSMFDNVRSVHV